MPPMRSASNVDSHIRRWGTFGIALLSVGTVWGILLPALSERESVREMIARNEALGIDPSAKFYTELPGMPDYFDRVSSATRRHAGSFGFRQRSTDSD